MSQSIVLCEGYHDRAFLKGLATQLGCTLSRLRPGGQRLEGGRFGYTTPRGRFVEVVPCDGVDKMAAQAEQSWKLHQAEQLVALVWCCDEDTAGGAPCHVTADRVRQFVRTHPDAPVIGAPWWCSDAPTAGLPDRNTLERVVCAAWTEAYSYRSAPVAAFLDAEPKGVASPKAPFLSHVAKWYPEKGPEATLSQIWNDPALRHPLIRRLQESGAWAALCGAFGADESALSG